MHPNCVLPCMARLCKGNFRRGNIQNSYLKMAGLLIFWLVMEEGCPKLQAAYVELLSENSPTIVWVKRLAGRGSFVTMQLVQVLKIQLKKSGASPLTP